MFTKSALFLIFLCAAVAAFKINDPIYNNNQYYQRIRACNEGEEQRRGSFVFRCQNGRLVPGGCVMEDGSQLPIGGTSSQNSFVTACVQGSGNSIQTKIVGCVDDNGQQVQPNSVFQWQGGQYRCIVNPNGGAEIQPVGDGGFDNIIW